MSQNYLVHSKCSKNEVNKCFIIFIFTFQFIFIFKKQVLFHNAFKYIYIMYNNEFIIMFLKKKEILKCIDAYAHFIIYIIDIFIYLLKCALHGH